MKLFLPFNVPGGHRPDKPFPAFSYSIFCADMSKGIASGLTISIIFILAAILCGDVLGAAPLYQDVTILDQTSTELSFKYIIGDTSWTADDASGDRILLIHGCDNLQIQGNPPVPIKTILIGIPARTKISLDVLSTVWSEDFPINYAGFNSGLVALPDIIEQKPRVDIRSQAVLPLNIYPLSLAAGVGKLMREITVRIRFELNAGKELNLGSTDEGRFEKIFSGLLLNYDQARAWRQMPEYNLSLESQDNIFSHSDHWIRIGVNSSGLYQINRQDLLAAGVDLTGVDPRTFRMFWGGGRPVEASLLRPRVEMREMAIHVDSEDDSSFDGQDYIMFYAPAANSFLYDSLQERLNYVHNPYTFENVLFLTYDASIETEPLRMPIRKAAPAETGSEVFSFREHKRYEEDNFLSSYQEDIYDYYRWYWIDDDSFDLNINIEDLTGSQRSKMTMSVAGRNVGLKIKGFDPDSVHTYEGGGEFWSDGFSSGLNRLTLIIGGNIRNDHLLDYLELEYQRRLQYRGGTLAFYGQDNSGDFKYVISGIAADSTYILCDISDMYLQQILTDFQQNQIAHSLEFEDHAEADRFKEYALAKTQLLYKPSSITPVEVDDLMNPSSSYDVIVITPRDFLPAFGAYRALRQAEGYNVFLAAVEDVYAQFAGGLPDPDAIRDFLKYAYESWPKPAPGFALLGGDGCYDFLNIKGRGKLNYIPPYVVARDTTVSDENYIIFDEGGWLDSDSSYPSDRGPDMVIARWPVRSATEVAQFVAKLAKYASGADNGIWQNRLTYVADDENKPGQTYKESEHTWETEWLATLHTPDRFDKNKIYEIEYPLDFRGEKSAAREKLIEAINSGTVWVNYIGHGNPRVWADERVFRNEDIASLTNSKAPTVVFTASCSIGEFDNPYEEGMAELLFRHPEAGAIATVAATRNVFGVLNANFNYRTFDVLFADPDYSLTEAVYIAKFLRQQISGPIENDRKFIVFGDPLMRVAFPPYGIRFAPNSLDSLAALNLVTVEGAVTDETGAILTDFDGTIDISVFDNQLEKVYKITRGETVENIYYRMPGARIFKGQTEVEHGDFTLQFVVPKDISYGGDNARVSAYAKSARDSRSASGSVDSIKISGSVVSLTDSTPPEIKVFLGDKPLADGLTVPRGQTLLIELFDSSGLNLSGEVGHKLEVSLDDDPLHTYDLTESFGYLPGSYQRGNAVFVLPQIQTGSHILKIKAWDSANNSGLAQYQINIGSGAQAEIKELLNVPNPFSGSTQFYYVLSGEASDVNLDIFTLAGRKVHSFTNLPGQNGENISAFWNGKDIWGDQLANGVYIYKLSVRMRAEMSDKSVEKFGKLVILR